MPRHRKSRRSQRGGLFGWGETNQSPYGQSSYSQGQYPPKKSMFDFGSWFGSSSNQPYGHSSSAYPSSSYSSSAYPSSSYSSSSYPRIPTGQQSSSYSNQPSGNIGMGWGGKNRKTLKMKGGRMSTLSPASVSGVSVVKPTYYLKNGGKRSKTQRRRKH